MFQVNLKPGHPTGVYHRAGLEFTASGPVELEEVPEAVRKDPWLIVTEGKGEKDTAEKKAAKEKEAAEKKAAKEKEAAEKKAAGRPKNKAKKAAGKKKKKG